MGQKYWIGTEKCSGLKKLKPKDPDSGSNDNDDATLYFDTKVERDEYLVILEKFIALIDNRNIGNNQAKIKLIETIM